TRDDPARREPTGAARHAAYRDHLRYRRERDHQRVREGHGHRERPADPDPGRLGALRGRGPGDDPQGGVARRRGAPAARGGRHEEPRRDARVPDRAVALRAPRQARRVRRLDDRGPGHGAAAGARERRPRRDPRQDGGVAGGLAQARRGGLRRGDCAGAGVRERRQRRVRLRRRGRRGGRVRGRGRGGAHFVSEEHLQQDEAQDESQVPGTEEEPSQAPDAEASGDAAVEDDRLLRLAADFENYKKRAARERQEYVALANERLIAEVLPILDDLERALAA